jgi:protein involved in polysaccharide export with SLBB domain
MSNEELDLLKSDVIATGLENLDSEEIDNNKNFGDINIDSNVESDNQEVIDDKYFGYNYFNRKINFYDNIPTPADYRLGPGDIINLSLWGITNLNKEIIIDKEGQIYYENVGFINLSNKTLEQAEKVLIKKLSVVYSTLSNKINETNLSINLVKTKSINVYFSGQIVNPGITLIHPFSDIFTAISQAGGIKTEGSLRNIRLIRNGKLLQSFDFYSFFIDGKSKFSNFRLLEGDIINIPVVENRVEIDGEVNIPGFFEIKGNESINDLINYTGGLKAYADPLIRIERIAPIFERSTNSLPIELINFDLVKNPNISLIHGDKITVRATYISDNFVTVYGRVFYPGVYSADYSLRTVLDQAGGFSDKTFSKTIFKTITVLRKNEKEFYGESLTVNYENSSKFELEAGDLVFVYEDIKWSNDFTYKIDGQVNKPGTYPLIKGTTLQDAIDAAQGLTEFANIEAVDIFVQKEKAGSETVELMKVNNIDLDYVLTDNSVITVQSMAPFIAVEGNVYNPGLVAYKKNMTMGQAIELAGGFKPYSLKKRAYVQRASGKVDKANIFRGKAKRVYNGDKVFVPVDPNPRDFDPATFTADILGILANIVAIMAIIDNSNN